MVGSVISARRAAAVGVIVATVALVGSGCVASEPPGYFGEPTMAGESLEVENSDGSQLPGDGSRLRAWSRGKQLIVTTNGSGSCPLIPVLEEIDAEKRQVSLSTSIPNLQGPCTTDSVFRTFELEAGRDLSGFTVQVATELPTE